MIGKILGSGQLGKLASFVSPAFFDVMPGRQLFSRARKLLSQSRDGALFKRVSAELASQLQAELPQIQLLTAASGKAQPGSTVLPKAPAEATKRADLVAELYFRQLFSDAPTLLDLRATSFTGRDDGLVWQPATWLAEWSPDFIGPLREIYRGFYTSDDALFRKGLATLKLSHSEDLFREQFGLDQSQVKFEVQSFIDIFHRVFLRCKEAGTALHPDFLPLGIYLAALYDHLQELHVPVDVRSAFERATQRTPTRAQSRAGAM